MKRGGKILTLVLLLAAGGGGAYYYFKVRRHRRDAPSYSPVTVSKGDLLVAVQATGTVQPENRLVIKPPINGRIDSVKVQEGQRVQKGQVLGLMSSTDRAALLDVAHSKGVDEVKHWEDLYRPTPIIAPMAGLVIARSIEPGQTIAATDQIFVMSDRLLVVAQVDETDMAKIKLGQAATLTLDAYPASMIVGTVHQIAYEAKTVNNVTVYDVQILPSEVPDFMRSGMTAGAQFKVDSRTGVLVLPATVIKRVGARTFVLQRTDDPEQRETKPDEVDVKLGLSDGKTVEILGGLAEGATVLQEALKLPEAEKSNNPFGGGPPIKGAGGGKRK